MSDGGTDFTSVPVVHFTHDLWYKEIMAQTKFQLTGRKLHDRYVDINRGTTQRTVEACETVCKQLRDAGVTCRYEPNPNMAGHYSIIFQVYTKAQAREVGEYVRDLIIYLPHLAPWNNHLA